MADAHHLPISDLTIQSSLIPSDSEMEKQSMHHEDGLCSPPEFDPSANAHPCSPFYLYKHDSPRPSTEQFKSKETPIHVSVVDLEAADAKLTPCTSTQQEKQDKGHLRVWSKAKQCMTRPKKRRLDWFRALPKTQQIIAEAVIALLIVGAMVGLGFGISAKVHGAVYKGDDQLQTIGN